MCGYKNMMLNYCNNITVYIKTEKCSLQMSEEGGIWKVYNPLISLQEMGLKTMDLRSVKAVILVEEPEKKTKILMQKKKAAGGTKSKKDGKLEFAGGKVEQHHESPCGVMKKELDEEDKTQIIRERFEQALTSGKVHYTIVTLKSNQKHLLYRFSVTGKQAKKIIKKNENPNSRNKEDHTNEVYGYKKISLVDLKNPKKSSYTKRTISFIKNFF